MPLDDGTPSEVVRAIVWVDGMVQGVGFRWWVGGQASRLGLVGSAENLFDGRVKVDAQGPASAVDELIVALTSRPGPGGRPGRVESFLVERRRPEPNRTGFGTW